MKPLNPYDTKPWFQQFWPWFLIALPGTVVVAALVTVFIAFRGADSEVNDEYYRDGLAIEQILERDLKAREHGLNARFLWDAITGEIVLTLTQESSSPALNLPEYLNLQLIHPGNENLDSEVKLNSIAMGTYRAEIESLIPNRYYLQLSPVPDENADIQWRLQGELNFSQTQQIDLHYR